MSEERKDQPQSQQELWAQRQKNNVRLGLAFGALAVVLFIIALLKYRPL